MMDLTGQDPGMVRTLVVGKKEWQDFKKLHEYVLARFTQTDQAKVERPLRVTFNIGGRKFQTLSTSIRYKGNSPIRLLDPEFLVKHWQDEHQWYFFDRDPEVFNAVLNFIRTGSLHLPKHICSPQIAAELIYWGIPRFGIQACCWKEFSTGIQSLENLHQLEKDRQPKYLNQNNLTQTALPIFWYQKLIVIVWKTLYDPSHSWLSKGYWFVSQLIVVCSIGLFAFATMPYLTEDLNCPYNVTNNDDMCSLHEIGKSMQHLNNARFTDIKPVSWVYFADIACFLFFAIELGMIILTCPNPTKFIQSPSGFIEIVALLPDLFTICLLILYVTRENVNTGKRLFKDVQVANSFRIFRIFRLFRLFRLIKRLPQLMIIVYSIWASLSDLFIVGTFVLSASIFFASILYFINSEKEFDNIPKGIWYGIVTMTTVGYGDMVPCTLGGRILGIMCAVCGVLVLGLSAPTLVHNFLTYFNLFRYIEHKEKEFMEDIKRNDKKNRVLTWDVDF